MEKKCSKCNLIKGLDEFYKRKTNKDGYHGVCKNCYDLRINEYNENNKEKRKEVNKKYNDSVKERRKGYYQENKERIIKRVSDRYFNVVKPNITDIDKEKGRDRSNKWRLDNPDKIKEYRLRSKDTKKDWYNNKRKSDNLFRLKDNISSLIRLTIKRNGFSKKSKTHQILGCSFEEFKAHIESLWEPWMNWENYGLYNGELNYGWDIDHIVPSSSAINEEGVIALNHYTNLQPLCSKVNRDIKRDTI